LIPLLALYVAVRGYGGTELDSTGESARREDCWMTVATAIDFKPEVYLAAQGEGRHAMRLKPRETFFSQGGASSCVYYLRSGRAKLTVLSSAGKEATITLLGAGDFIGEEAMVGAGGLRMATATAITGCIALRIDREEMVRVLHREQAFSDFFLRFLLTRGMRTQADLVDQLFNSSEKRLARTLLLMAEFGMPGEPETLIPEITQEALAEMIGTTRSRVSFFMNRFRKLGLIEYNGRIRVHKSLLNLVLHDQFPQQNVAPRKVRAIDPATSTGRSVRAGRPATGKKTP
jgi:CRP-like cAMP-binding protein